ncbi:hypothetical protein GCM10028807_25090 [Spirosoma daeguense]
MDSGFNKSHSVVLFRFSFFILFGLLSFTDCLGQQKRGARGLVSFGSASGMAEDTMYLDINQDIAVQLLPFDEIVKVAVTHSPLIKYQNEVVNGLDAAHAVSKVQILQNVSGFVNGSIGNQSLTSSLATAGPDIQLNNGYRAGVDVRLPLYELFGRKHQIRQAASNYKAAVIQKDVIELQLRRELIAIYQDMITAQQLLKIRLMDEQASLTALRVAEAELQKGAVSADAVSIITSRYVQAKTSSEQSKGDFLKNVHYFEALTGSPIQRLKRNN